MTTDAAIIDIELEEDIFACLEMIDLIEDGWVPARLQLEDALGGRCVVVCSKDILVMTSDYFRALSSTNDHFYPDSLTVILCRCLVAEGAAMLAYMHQQLFNPSPLVWKRAWAELSAQWGVRYITDAYSSMIRRTLLDAAKFSILMHDRTYGDKASWWEKATMAIQHNTYHAVISETELERCVLTALNLFGDKLWDPECAEALGVTWVVKIASMLVRRK